jgi:hypothetical protein
MNPMPLSSESTYSPASASFSAGIFSPSSAFNDPEWISDSIDRSSNAAVDYSAFDLDEDELL